MEILTINQLAGLLDTIGGYAGIFAGIMSIILTIAVVISRNSIVDIVNSFETQNSQAFEFRYNVFMNALKVLEELNSTKNIEASKVKLAKAYDELLVCANNKATLRAFEKAVSVYSKTGEVTPQALRAFRATMRKDFGNESYASSVIEKMGIVRTSDDDNSDFGSVEPLPYRNNIRPSAPREFEPNKITAMPDGTSDKPLPKTVVKTPIAKPQVVAPIVPNKKTED